MLEEKRWFEKIESGIPQTILEENVRKSLIFASCQAVQECSVDDDVSSQSHKHDIWINSYCILFQMQYDDLKKW